MKKRLLIFLSGVIGIAVFAYLYRYHSSPNIYSELPLDTEEVVMINTRNIEKLFFHDFLSRPMAYLGKKKSKGVQKKTDQKEEKKIDYKKQNKNVRLEESLKIPSSLFLYRCKSAPMQWTSSDLKVKNLEALSQFLRAQGYDETIDQEERTFTKGAHTILCKNGNARWYLNASNLPIENTTFLEKGDSLYDQLHSANSDIVYRTKNGNSLNIQFFSGSINVNGKFSTEIIEPNIYSNSSSSVGSISCNLAMDKLKNVLSDKSITTFENFTKLDLDSLSTYSSGNICASLEGFEMVSDTITTYEYDDDFNKVEVQKVNLSPMPSYTIQMDMTSKGNNYLKQQKAIVNDEGRDVLAIMPLAKTYASYKDQLLKLSTNNTKPSLSESGDKLNFQVNIQSLLQDLPQGYISMQNLLKRVKEIKLNIDASDKVNATIATQGNRNAIVSLIKGE